MHEEEDEERRDDYASGLEGGRGGRGLGDGGRTTLVGTSGLAFSPCGGWVYAGTEAGVGEWEVGGGKRGWKVEGDGGVG